MIHPTKIEPGIMAYINAELVPQMPLLAGVAFASAAPFVVRAKVNAMLPTISGTELEKDGLIDDAALLAEFKKNMNGKWPVEMFGFNFAEQDLDRLMDYIRRV